MAKIPTFLATSTIPAELHTYSTGPDWGRDWEALAHLARGVGAAAGAIGEMNARADDETAKDETARLTSGVPAQIEQLHEAVQQPYDEQTNPHGYPAGEQPSQTLIPRFQKGFTQLHQDTAALATGPRTERYLGRYFDHTGRAALTQAVRDRFTVYRSEQQAEIPERLRDYATGAIAAGDPDLRAFQVEQAESYLNAKTVLKPDQRAQLLRTFKDDVAWGSAARAVKAEPDQDLAPLIKDLSPANALKLQDLARSEQARKASDLREAHVQLDRGMKVYQEGVERYFVTGLDRGTTTEDDFQTFAEYLPSEKIDAYRKAYRERQTGGGPGDPTTIRSFKAAVYSPDLRGEADVQRIGRQLTSAFAADLIPEKEFTPMQSHLQTLADRFNQRAERATVQADTKADRAKAEQDRISDSIYGETREAIRQQLKSTGGILADLDTASEDAQALAMEDLARETARGRSQSASAWWNENRPRYLARVQSRAQSRSSQLKQSINDKIPELQADPLSPEFQLGVTRLRDLKPTYSSETAWLDDVRRARELHRLSQEMLRLQLLLNPPKPTEPKK